MHAVQPMRQRGGQQRSQIKCAQKSASRQSMQPGHIGRPVGSPACLCRSLGLDSILVGGESVGSAVTSSACTHAVL